MTNIENISGAQVLELWQKLQKLPALAEAAHEAITPSLGQMADDIKVSSSSKPGEPLNGYALETCIKIVATIEQILREIELYNNTQLGRGKLGYYGIPAGMTSRELFTELEERVILIEIWCPAGASIPDFNKLANIRQLYSAVRSVHLKASVAFPIPGVENVPGQPARPCPLECGGNVRVKTRDNATKFLRCSKCKTELDINETLLQELGEEQ